MSVLLEPIERPTDRDGNPILGSRGKRINLRANVFPLKLTTPVNTVWYKYQVTVLSARSTTSTGLPPTLPPKSLLRKIWQELEVMAQQDSTIFQGLRPVYDGRNACYAAAPLPQDTTTIAVRMTNPTYDMNTRSVIEAPSRSVFNVTISNGVALHVDELKKWYMATDSSASQSEADGCLAALNTIFHHGLALHFPAAKNTFYIDEGPAQDLSAKANLHSPHLLPRGLVLWRGFFESVRTSARGIYLNVDTTTGVFVKPGNLLKFILSYIDTSNARSAYTDVIRPHDLIRINRLLKGTQIDINLEDPARNKHKIKVRVGLSRLSARHQKFEIRGSGEVMSIEQYFWRTFSLRLDHPGLPCVEVKPGVLYPVELCTILPGTLFKRRLDAQQQLAATHFQTLLPGERLEVIRRLGQTLLPRLHGPYIEQFNVSMPGARAEPLELFGRVLAPPEIDYGQGIKAPTVDQGVWKMLRRQQRFIDGSAVSSFAVIVSRRQDAQQVLTFIEGFFRGLIDLGMEVPSRRAPPNFAAINGSNNVKATINQAFKLAGDFYGKPPQIIFWAFGTANDPDYHAFKAEGVRLGVATQALQSKNLNKTDDFQFFINLGMKVNAKLRGQNFALKRGTTSGDKRAGWLESHPAIVFGADLTHTDGKPSIATVVASMDRGCIIYEEAISVQGLVDPPANNPEARPKKQEVIVNLAEMVTSLLLSFFAKIGDQSHKAPESLVFYRDGVSESEWPAILAHELPAVRLAVQYVKQAKNVPNWAPLITFIVCMKRHHIRFFGNPQDRGSTEGKSGNIPAGTVVDTGVVDARAFDWYAAAHNGLLGTSRPTRYVVMEDEQEPRMTANDLQSFTNALCYVYQRCNRAVSIPAPVYYADIICSKVRSWMPDEGASAASSVGGGSSYGTPGTRQDDLNNYRDKIASMREGLDAFKGSPANAQTGAAARKASMWFI